MREKAFTMFVSVCVLLTFISTATADVYYATPPTVYVRPDPSYQTGQAIGSVLGMLLQGAQNSSEKDKRAKFQKKMKEVVINDANGVANSIKQIGVEFLIYNAQSMWRNNNTENKKEFTNNGYSLYSITQATSDSSRFRWDYTINLIEQVIEAKLSYPDFNMSEVAYTQYSLPDNNVPLAPNFVKAYEDEDGVRMVDTSSIEECDDNYIVWVKTTWTDKGKMQRSLHPLMAYAICRNLITKRGDRSAIVCGSCYTSSGTLLDATSRSISEITPENYYPMDRPVDRAIYNTFIKYVK